MKPYHQAWLTLGLGLFVLVVPTVVFDQSVTCLFVVPLLVSLLLLAPACPDQTAQPAARARAGAAGCRRGVH